MYIFLSTYSGYYLNCSVLITGKKRKHTSNNILIVTKTYPSHTDVIVQFDTTQTGKLHLKINCLLNLRIWYVATHSLSTRIEEKKKSSGVHQFFFFNFQFPVGSHTDLWVSFLDVTDGTCLFDRIDIFEGITSRTFTIHVYAWR